MYKTYEGRFGLWAAIEKSSGGFVGWFLFRPDWDDRENTSRIELGYRLKKSFWGKGYASEMAKALIEKGFRDLGVEVIYAVCMQSNAGSRRVMEKCGLALVREFFDPKYPWAEVPEVEYALTNPAVR